MDKPSDLNVLEEFLEFPLETGDGIFNKFLDEFKGKVKDLRIHGTAPARFLYIPGKRTNKVLLVAHADTFWDKHHILTKKQKERGKGIGADDRAGCAILWLLKDSGHSLLITDGEENSSDTAPEKKGSFFLRLCNKELFEKINREHQFAIQFDRMGNNDCVFYKVGDDKQGKFKKYVLKKMENFVEKLSDGKTDICVICRDICGVNLSIGYYNEHNWDKESRKPKKESRKPEEWLNTLNICREWLAEENLPKFKL